MERLCNECRFKNECESVSDSLIDCKRYMPITVNESNGLAWWLSITIVIGLFFASCQKETINIIDPVDSTEVIKPITYDSFYCYPVIYYNLPKDTIKFANKIPHKVGEWVEVLSFNILEKRYEFLMVGVYVIKTKNKKLTEKSDTKYVYLKNITKGHVYMLLNGDFIEFKVTK